MPTPIAQKLRIKEDYILLAIHAPLDFENQLHPLPAHVKVLVNTKNYNQVHWFVKNKTQLENELQKILPLIKNDVICWIYYPKRTSKIQTDLTRDKGWDSLLKHDDTLTWISLVSFDETWSVFGFRLKTEADKKKRVKENPRPIFDYIDAKTKTIRLPADLAEVMQKNKIQERFFNTLSFTNRKEYVEWIVTAKKEETRAQRIKDTIERLGKEWKNPGNL